MKLMPHVHNRLASLADIFAVLLAASLPWSTSATGILTVLWLLAFIPVCDLTSLRRIAFSPAGGLPLILATFGALGMLWADVAWSERFGGLSSFYKLLFIPLLLHYFSDNGSARGVLIGFLASCTLLLLVSWAIFAWPDMPFPVKTKGFGVPVKDYISQGAMFTICMAVVLHLAIDAWRAGRRDWAAGLAVLALVFIANVLIVATSRTSLVVVPVLLVLFGYRQFGWKGMIAAVAAFVVLLAVVWPSAGGMRSRMVSFVNEIRTYQPDGPPTAAGERLVYWMKSVEFVAAAPIFGHGTGSIRDQFRKSAVGRGGMAGQVSANPHNQILAVGIQLGGVGIAILIAMWLAHLALFGAAGIASWIGLIVVIQNIVGSLFNSHLFDFTHGWLYVVGVGVAGGAALKERLT